MNFKRMLIPLSVLLTSIAHAELAPEAVYEKFHQAIIERNFEAMRAYGTAKSGNDLAAMPAEMRAGMIEYMARVTPDEFEVVEILETSKGLTLELSAEGGSRTGQADLIQESGVWRVDQFEWPGSSASITFDKSGNVTVSD